VRIPVLPHPITDLEPGELVLYSRWCPKSEDWVTDGVPHLVVDVMSGIALVLMSEGTVRVPMTLLRRIGDNGSPPCS